MTSDKWCMYVCVRVCVCVCVCVWVFTISQTVVNLQLHHDNKPKRMQDSNNTPAPDSKIARRVDTRARSSAYIWTSIEASTTMI